jgi:amino acid adenylation domain-containing protein
MIELDIISKLKQQRVFPKLENDQLKLIGDVKSLSPDLIQMVRSNKEVLIQFLSESKENSTRVKPIESVETKASYPLSNAQKRIWVLSQFEGGNQAYNIAETFIIKGEVDIEKFELATRESIRRHESLRTSFQIVEDKPRQIVSEDWSFDVEVNELPKHGDFVTSVKKEQKKFRDYTFDLERCPLLRIAFYTTDTDKMVLMVNMHHIISDGWSSGILLQEIFSNYRTICTSGTLESTELEIQYKDYTAWLDGKIQGSFGDQARSFWKEKNLNDVDPINLPLDFPRAQINEFDGNQLKFIIDPKRYDEIVKFARENNSTYFNFFRAVLSIVLHKWTAQDELIMGTPVAGRSHHQLEDQIGLYVNTLPLKSHFEGQRTFLEYFSDVSSDSLKVFKFQDYPLDLIIDQADIKRDPARNPLFDVMMVVQNTEISDGSLNIRDQHGFELSYFDELKKESDGEHRFDVTSKFDLSFNFSFGENTGHILTIEYKNKLFKKSKIQSLFKLIQFVTDQILTYPTIKLANIQTINADERRTILNRFNTEIQVHEEKSILSLLETNLTSLKDETAILLGEKKVSYDEVNFWSKGYATRYLDFPNSERVGLFMERSEHIIYSILGAFYAQKAYVPIDTKYPQKRVDYILEDAELDLIVVDSVGESLLPESYKGEIIRVDEIRPNLEFTFNDSDCREDTAYLIYTSGSTGKPKGVEIVHRNVVAFLKWCQNEFSKTPFDNVYAGTSYCFDLSIFEMLFPLSLGKTIRILESAIEIPDYLREDQAVLINTVPSVVRSLLDQEMDWKNVVALNMAGEPVPRIFKEQLDWKRMEVRNLYGPSEDTTYSTCYRFEDDQLNYIPIGVPVGDTHLYIVDSDLNLLPIGVEGEICLSGESVAKGYYNKEELTQEKFVSNPFLESKRLYRTGDIGKWSDKGHVEFLGRMDDQVKVRGFRIELGEIQFQAEQLPEIDQAVVTVMEINEELRIVLYYAANTEVLEQNILDELHKHLPVYMIPDYCIQLEKIPLNSNGKVDKSQLPIPTKTSQVERVLPRNKSQEQLFDIWKQVLGVGDFGIKDNFFELGGHSLKAAKLKSLVLRSFEKELTLNEIFQFTTIEKQSELLDGKGRTQEVRITVSNKEENYFPLSFAQERLWVLTKFEEASKAYHMPAAFEITGNLDVEMLQEAINQVVNRHGSLRTVFREVDNHPYQFVLEPPELSVTINKVVLDESDGIKEALDKDWERPFDLENGPLIRCTLFEQPTRRVLSFNMHHIISDGWSMGVLFNDVVKSYALLKHDDASELPELEIQYHDFTVWQRAELTDEVLSEQLAYWKSGVFEKEVTPLELPYKGARPEIKTYNGATSHYALSKELSQAVLEQSISHGTSLFMGLMANVKVLLKKLSNSDDIIVGTPVSGRETQQLQNQIGFFINTLPVRSNVNGKIPFSEFLKIQREQLLNAFSNQHFPFEMLVEELQLKRDMSRSPLFDVMIVLQNFDEFENTAESLDIATAFKKLDFVSSHTKYDLTFSFSESTHGLNLELEYNTDLFSTDLIDSIAEQFQLVIQATTSQPDVLIEDVSILSESQREVLTSKLDQTQTGYHKEETIISLFQHAAKSFPDACALKVDDKEFTFKELDTMSGQLSRVLRDSYNVKKEDLIVLHTTRSEWMIVSMLATLKAGAAYVPVDPEYPSSRIQYIIQDSESTLVLTDEQLSENTRTLVSEIEVLNVSEVEYSGDQFVDDISSEQLAYIIYTSGTTGQPKGVLIEHRNVNRLLFNENNLFDFNESDRWSLFHSYCFDFSVWEIYGALLNGGTLVMVPKTTAQDGTAFYNFLKEEKITVLNQTPTAFRSLSLLNKDKYKETSLEVRYVIFGGEALLPEILKDWNNAFPDCKLINMYGITETTVHVTYKEITESEIANNKSNIGLPIPTLSCFVLDKDLQPCAIGVIGELCVGGAGVARGYHKKAELTEEKFVRNPFDPASKIYRSGDFARILPNGDLEYIGRKDDQVKIRGHRIELAEVETAIKEFEAVKEAVVIPFKNSNDEYELACYLIINKDAESSNYRSILGERLPGYMIPNQFILMEEFPMTSNGKLDKKSLPNPTSDSTSRTKYVPPRNNIDRQIIEIWRDVLEQEKIGIQDNFFDLGGHSLKATRVISKIQVQFDVKIDLKNLFASPVVESLSDYVETLSWMNKSEEANKDVDLDELIL